MCFTAGSVLYRTAGLLVSFFCKFCTCFCLSKAAFIGEIKLISQAAYICRGRRYIGMDRMTVDETHNPFVDIRSTSACIL